MKVRPLGNRILVKPVKKKVSDGGIVIPNELAEVPQRAIVVDIGPEAKCVYKAGDEIIFAQMAGQPVVIDKEVHLVMFDGDVIALLEQNKVIA